MTCQDRYSNQFYWLQIIDKGFEQKAGIDDNGEDKISWHALTSDGLQFCVTVWFINDRNIESRGTSQMLIRLTALSRGAVVSHARSIWVGAWTVGTTRIWILTGDLPEAENGFVAGTGQSYVLSHVKWAQAYTFPPADAPKTDDEIWGCGAYGYEADSVYAGFMGTSTSTYSAGISER